ncbi:MAG TPA: hypothetical protein VFO77_02895, partial [Actinoplanes sp.]|nr:hypothetical protein [Actinoplanes sp.]
MTLLKLGRSGVVLIVVGMLAVGSPAGPATAGPAAVAPAAVALAVAPATPILYVDAPITHLGFTPGDAIASTIRIRNGGTATAHNVYARLRVTRAEGVTVGLPGASQDCVSDATRAACRIGDLPPAGSATITVDWRLVRQHYDESAAMSISATADDAQRRVEVTGA